MKNIWLEFIVKDKANFFLPKWFTSFSFYTRKANDYLRSLVIPLDIVQAKF